MSSITEEAARITQSWVVVSEVCGNCTGVGCLQCDYTGVTVGLYEGVIDTFKVDDTVYRMNLSAHAEEVPVIMEVKE